MKLLKSWLNDYIDLNLPNHKIADILINTGVDVDNIESYIDKNIIVAKIIDISKHKNADKLKKVIVTDGNKKYQIVCGADNIKVNMMVPLALPGADIQGVKIIETKIKGVKSQGMLCSEKELAIGNDHSGIYDLSDQVKLKNNLFDDSKNDAVFNVDITPNRGDWASHIGIARELSAFINQNIAKEPINLTMTTKLASDNLSVEVNNSNDCPRYLARIIEGVTVAPSPDWLKTRIEKVGLKPINNIVDATNYILFDLGQPLHAFDYNKIKGKRIIVRRADKRETITTIDNSLVCLNNDDLVISDSKKAVALAGVVGGSETEVTKYTKNVLIEAACFNPKLIRNTSKNHNIITEASYRFERGVDAKAVEYALNKAVKIIKDISGGSILNGIVDKSINADKKRIDLEINNINKLIGVDFPDHMIATYLKRVGFEIKKGYVEVPSWRHDINYWQDLAEEVGKIYGYNNIKKIPINKKSININNQYHKIQLIKDKISDLGICETINYPFLSLVDTKIADIKGDKLIEIKNPIQEDLKYLRNSLIPGLLKNVSRNPFSDDINIFEIGKIYLKTKEFYSLAVMTAGKKSIDIKDIKNKLESKFNINLGSYIFCLDKDQLKKYKIKKASVNFFEIPLSKIVNNVNFSKYNLNLKLSNKEIKYHTISKYPSVLRDLAFIADSDIDHNKIINEIYTVSDYIYQVELFDQFKSERFGKNKKNLAFHVNLQSQNETLKDEVANEIIVKVINKIENKFNAKLRK